MKLNTLLAALAFSAAPLSIASAADVYVPLSPVNPISIPMGDPWTGFYLGMGGGGAAVNHDLKAAVTGASVELNGLGGMGGFGTLQAGYDHTLGSHFVMGLFFDYDLASVTGGANYTFGTHGASIGTKLTNSWTAGGRLGYLVTANTLAYGLGGYTQSHYDMPFNVNGDFSGWTAGAGIETHLGGGWFLKGEYRYTALGEKTLGYISSVRVTDQPEEQSGRLLLVYKLNSGGLGGSLK